MDLATDVEERQTVAVKFANIFGVALDKNVNIDDTQRLTIVAARSAAMGLHRGFVTLLKEKVRQHAMKLRCITHQENI